MHGIASGHPEMTLLHLVRGSGGTGKGLHLRDAHLDREQMRAGNIGCSAVRRPRMPVRILIADDDATIRLLLRRLLEKQIDWEVCGEASNGIEAIEKVAQLAPDILIMDLAMPKMSGMQAARTIAARYPQLPMLSFSVEQVSVYFAE